MTVTDGRRSGARASGRGTARAAAVEQPSRTHARSGDRIALAAYLGGSGKFDEAIADFAEAYADQNERDYAALRDAAKDGNVESTTEF